MINQLKKFIPKSVKHFIKMQLHRGDRYVCPFCGFCSKDFGLVGVDVPVLREKQVIGGGARMAACFKCDSDDRERLVFVYLKEKLEIFEHKNWRILHIAPEPNLAKKIRQSNFRKYVCGDLAGGRYKYMKHVKSMDLADLPLENESFDLVICNHVLEHIREDQKAMNEIRRVLTKKGRAILQVPISANSENTDEDPSVLDDEERTAKFGQPEHVRIYGQDYLRRLEKNGFTVTRVNISTEFPQFGLNPKEDLFVCEPATETK